MDQPNSSTLRSIQGPNANINSRCSKRSDFADQMPCKSPVSTITQDLKSQRAINSSLAQMANQSPNGLKMRKLAKAKRQHIVNSPLSPNQNQQQQFVRHKSVQMRQRHGEQSQRIIEQQQEPQVVVSPRQKVIDEQKKQIHKENMQQLKRLQDMEPSIDFVKLQSQEEERQRLLQTISKQKIQASNHQSSKHQSSMQQHSQISLHQHSKSGLHPSNQIKDYKGIDPLELRQPSVQQLLPQDQNSLSKPSLLQQSRVSPPTSRKHSATKKEPAKFKYCTPQFLQIDFNQEIKQKQIEVFDKLESPAEKILTERKAMISQIRASISNSQLQKRQESVTSIYSSKSKQRISPGRMSPNRVSNFNLVNQTNHNEGSVNGSRIERANSFDHQQSVNGPQSQHHNTHQSSRDLLQKIPSVQKLQIKMEDPSRTSFKSARDALTKVALSQTSKNSRQFQQMNTMRNISKLSQHENPTQQNFQVNNQSLLSSREKAPPKTHFKTFKNADLFGGISPSEFKKKQLEQLDQNENQLTSPMATLKQRIDCGQVPALVQRIQIPKHEFVQNKTASHQSPEGQDQFNDCFEQRQPDSIYDVAVFCTRQLIVIKATGVTKQEETFEIRIEGEQQVQEIQSQFGYKTKIMIKSLRIMHGSLVLMDPEQLNAGLNNTQSKPKSIKQLDKTQVEKRLHESKQSIRSIQDVQNSQRLNQELPSQSNIQSPQSIQQIYDCHKPISKKSSQKRQTQNHLHPQNQFQKSVDSFRDEDLPQISVQQFEHKSAYSLPPLLMHSVYTSETSGPASERRHQKSSRRNLMEWDFGNRSALQNIKNQNHQGRYDQHNPNDTDLPAGGRCNSATNNQNRPIDRESSEEKTDSEAN